MRLKNRRDMSEFKNILLIQLGDIGDVVLTTPAIRAAKETFPDAHISILVRKPFGHLLIADPSLHEIVQTEKFRGALLYKFWKYILFARRLRRTHYDLVINLRTGDRGAVLSFLTRAPVRIGVHEDNKPFWYNHIFTKLLLEPPYAKLPVHPGADQSLRIVRAIGIDTKNSIPKLHIAQKDRDHAVDLLAECGLTITSKWITINPCSRWKYKEWGYEKWGEVIDRIWQNHRIPVLLIGSPEETPVAEVIVAGRNEHTFNLAGRTTLGELSALIAISTLHLGVDSAAPHIAAAVGTPTVTIFGPGNWKGWTVVDSLHHVVTADLPCVPCGRMGCEDTGKSRCLDQLRTEAVLEKICSVIREIGRLE